MSLHEPEAEAALELAADLSSRARREAETARRLTEHLARMPRAGLPEVSSAPPRTMAIGCRTCGLDVDVPLLDPDAGAAQARSFFARHGDCLTYVDLEPLRRVPRAL